MTDKLPKPYFSLAADRLSTLCNRIDNEGEEIDNLILKEFDDALSDVTNSVDRRKAFYRELESKIELAREFRKTITLELKRFELIKERLLEKTKEVILSNPGVPFKDSFGKPLKVIDNPVPKLVLEEACEFPRRYIRIVETYEINKDLIKEDLLDNKELSWARLEYGTQLRGIK